MKGIISQHPLDKAGDYCLVGGETPPDLPDEIEGVPVRKDPRMPVSDYARQVERNLSRCGGMAP